jgi:Rod binding domain-containing protein
MSVIASHPLVVAFDGIRSAAVPQPRLVQASHEFEAQLMKELLKPLANGSSIDGDDSDADSGRALADFATEALGQALSRHGGLGIATKLVRSLSRNENEIQVGSHAGNEASSLSSNGVAVLK